MKNNRINNIKIETSSIINNVVFLGRDTMSTIRVKYKE